MIPEDELHSPDERLLLNDNVFLIVFRQRVIPPFLIELMGKKFKALLLFKNRWTTILLTYEVVHDYKSTASQLYSPAPRSDLEINIDLDTHNVLYD